jgi:hypothetical protein
MTHSPMDLIDHDPEATLVHAVNSQLVEVLFGDSGFLNALLVDKTAWIINVLYAHGLADTAPVLKTSATLHRGTSYDHLSPRGGAVQSIDETVPLATSVSGRCILSGRPIWLGKRELVLRDQGFAEKYYRRFSLVQVQTEGYKVPRAEIVFPIAKRYLNVSNVVGALNLELFGEDPPDADAYIASLPRESISELLAGLLQIHSGYLKVAVDILDLQPCSDVSERLHNDFPVCVDACSESIKMLHRTALKLFIRRNSKNIEHLVGALQEIAARLLRPSRGNLEHA